MSKRRHAMRNILVHEPVRATRGPRGVQSIAVHGHAFDVDKLEVSLTGAGTSRKMVVEVSPNGQWLARFDGSHDALPESWTPGCDVRAVAADMTDPEGCYASMETRITG